MNEVLKAMEERRSCRSFLPEQLKEGDLEQILRAGTFAATGMGRQSPKIVVLQNPEDIAVLDSWAALGVRLGMLTWHEENALATGAKGDPQKGLTMAGWRVVRRMRELGMLVDVSHLNDGGFWDVIKLARGPVVASHSNCRALCDVPRNLTDNQLRAIRDTGGVVGLNVYHAFVHADPAQQTAEMLARHAAHMAEVMGVEHVACGFDFCEFFGPGNEGAEGLKSAAHIKNLFYWLEKLGMSERERRMIARENFLRVLGS